MKLFETTFTFAEVLSVRPGGDKMLSHELTDLAWHRWHKADVLAFERHEDHAYATIDTTQCEGYVVTIQVQRASINLQKAREEYIAMEGNRCPVCLSQEVEGGHIEVDGGGAHQEITCLQCRSTWVDQYTLVRIEDLIVREASEVEALRHELQEAVEGRE